MKPRAARLTALLQSRPNSRVTRRYASSARPARRGRREDFFYVQAFAGLRCMVSSCSRLCCRSRAAAQLARLFAERFYVTANIASRPNSRTKPKFRDITYRDGARTARPPVLFRSALGPLSVTASISPMARRGYEADQCNAVDTLKSAGRFASNSPFGTTTPVFGENSAARLQSLGRRHSLRQRLHGRPSPLRQRRSPSHDFPALLFSQSVSAQSTRNGTDLDTNPSRQTANTLEPAPVFRRCSI